MIRQDVGRKSKVWGGASERVRNGVQGVLVALLESETQRTMRKHVCEIVGRLASHRVASGDWKALIPALNRLCRSQNPMHLESALRVCSVLGEFAVEAVAPMLAAVYKIIGKCLQSQNSTLQVAALSASASFIMSLTGNGQRMFIKLIPSMLSVLAALATRGDDDALCDCIDDIAQLLGFKVQLFAAQVSGMVKLMAKIAGHKDLEPSTRRTALSLIVELAKKDRSGVKRVREVCTQVIPLAMHMLLELDDSIQDWTESEEEREPDDEDFCMAWDTLDYLASYLGGGIVLAAAWPFVQKFLAAPGWKHRHAALSALAALMPGCRRVMQPKVAAILKMLVPMATAESQHVRVRWAAINCVGHMCVEFAPDLQAQFLAPVLRVLLAGVASRANVRIAAHSALCLVDLCREADPTAVTKFAGDALGHLAKLLAINNIAARVGALSAVSALASILEGEFDRFYKVFAPAVMKLASDAKASAGADAFGTRRMQAKAIECVGVMGSAVGRERFLAQCEPFMKFLLRTQRGLEADDPRQGAILQTCARVCQCMGAAFRPYLRMVIPPLLKAAANNQCASMQDVDDEFDQRDGFEVVDFAVRGVGNKRLVVNSAMLEEKATACNMLYQYASELREVYYPYVAATAKVMVPLIKYRYNQGVRVAAVDTIPALLEATKAHFEKANQDARLVTQLFTFAFTPYLAALKLEGQIDALEGILRSFSDAIDTLPGPMQPAQVRQTHEVIAFILSESTRRRQEYRRELKQADDELRAELQESLEEEDSMVGMVGSVIRSMATKCEGAYVGPFTANLFQIVWPFLNPDPTRASAAQNLMALLTLNEVVMRGGSAAKPFASKLLPIALRFAGNPDEDIRQTACYAIGACAVSLGESGFAKSCGMSLQCLAKVITAQDARGEKYGIATDNAISSVGKICKQQKSANAGAVAKVLPVWLSWLPARNDKEEAPTVHNLLCDFLEDPKSPIYGPNRSNLPAIFKVLATIAGTDLVGADGSARVSSLITRIVRAVGRDAATQLMQQVGPEAAGKVRRLVQGF